MCNAKIRYKTRWMNTAFNVVVVLCLLGGIISNSFAGSTERNQAKRIHDRLAGVPPSATVLNEMETLLNSGDVSTAAYKAMENPNFYNLTLKNFVTPWTNEEQTVFAPLNDYTATIIGIVRDDIDFRQALYGDIIYVGAVGVVSSEYSKTDNDHYEKLEIDRVDLSDNNKFKKKLQSLVTGLPPDATAGVLTSRAAAQAFLKDGTNRAHLRFTLVNHLCTDLEQLKDVTRAPDRVRQDVSRSPGGDSRIFLNACIGCHTGMDPLIQAFSYYDYKYDEVADPEGLNGQLDFNKEGDVDDDTGTRVQGKYHINANNFKYGFVTPDERWDNYWRKGKNAALGWDQTLSGSGTGAKTMAMELAHSGAFARCQVEKVFKTVCLREPTAADSSQVNLMVTSFKSNTDSKPYNMKRVFAEVAEHCMDN